MPQLYPSKLFPYSLRWIMIKHMEKMQTLEREVSAEESIVGSEKSFLENAKGKAKKAARLFAMVTALSLATAGSESAMAQQSGNHEASAPKTEWASTVLDNAETQSEQVMTAEDVSVFETTMLKPFLDHVGMLSNGAEAASNYSPQEYHELLLKAKELQGFFKTLETKFAGSVHNKNIDYVIRFLTQKSSFKAMQQKQMLENVSLN